MNDAHAEVAAEIGGLGFDEPGRDVVTSALAGISCLSTFDEGTVIFHEGEMHDRLYFICAGTVSLEMVTAHCGKRRILSMGAGDMLAWSGLLGDGRMTTTAVAVETARMIDIPVESLRSLCAANFEVGYRVMIRVAEALSRRLLATRLQLLDVYRVEEA